MSKANLCPRFGYTFADREDMHGQWSRESRTGLLDTGLPPLVRGEAAQWPDARRWVNVAAVEDPVALVKELAPLFGKKVEDHLVRNGRFGAHSVRRYLTTAEVARGIADGLAGH
ncbi:hypothetical protein [Streptomyces sp. ODS05-4]|uniref:hypothetical protein n=1 Tax=Streptomyces sp. ODS05-4 TaxID=2944939 RepID=UPI00210D92AD|nr:hypothetical protein [Streptomyces sp. ODS05-4]